MTGITGIWTGARPCPPPPPRRPLEAAVLELGIQQAVADLRAEHHPDWKAKTVCAANEDDCNWPCPSSLVADRLDALIDGA